MESRLQPIVLASLMVLGGHAMAAEGPSSDERVLDDVVQPGITRRTIEDGKIDTENFEIGLYGGVMSVEDFGTSDVYGLRLAYHVTEDFFIEANYGVTTTQKTSAESLDRIVLLTDEQRKLSYYSADFGYNLLPGEHYLGKWAFNTNFYIVAGAGNTLFADNEYFTYNFGAGLRVFATDWLALHADFRNYVFTHSILGEDKEVQNLECSLGLTLFF